MSASEWVRLTEAGEHYGVGADTVRDWITRGWIPGYRVGKLLMIRRDDLESFAKPAQVTR